MDVLEIVEAVRGLTAQPVNLGLLRGDPFLERVHSPCLPHAQTTGATRCSQQPSPAHSRAMKAMNCRAVAIASAARSNGTTASGPVA
jgi:hypothetical protein